MPVEITTIINQVDSDIQSNKIETIHYSINAVDGEYTAGTYGTVSVSSSDTFPDYDTVTEQDCIDFVEEKVNINQMRGSLTSQIQRKKVPVKRKDLPWQARA